jgi:hypothetical protein
VLKNVSNKKRLEELLRGVVRFNVYKSDEEKQEHFQKVTNKYKEQLKNEK